MLSNLNHGKFKNKAGVYRIIDTYMNKSYIGSSNDLYIRIAEHRRKLHLNNSSNSSLQEAYNVNEGIGFEVEVLELTSKAPKDLKDAEDFYIKKYNSRHPDFGYNLVGANRPTVAAPSRPEARRRVVLVDAKSLEIFKYDRIQIANQSLRHFAKTGGLYKDKYLVFYQEEFNAQCLADRIDHIRNASIRRKQSMDKHSTHFVDVVTGIVTKGSQQTIDYHKLSVDRGRLVKAINEGRYPNLKIVTYA